MDWFSVDKEGLSRLLERRGKHVAIFELIQNAWDEQACRVTVTLVPVPHSPYARLTVEDDNPDGFADLSHAFTLFADSGKKVNPQQRGRFNIGEKLVLALCREASISSTKGTVSFEADGTRRRKRIQRECGTVFNGVLRMTRDEYAQTCQAVRTLIPPQGVETTFNGEVLVSRQPVDEFQATLETEIADAEGYLRRTRRRTTVRVYEPLAGEMPSLYELGIPVVETDDRYHYEVMQKVPLNVT